MFQDIIIKYEHMILYEIYVSRNKHVLNKPFNKDPGRKWTENLQHLGIQFFFVLLGVFMIPKNQPVELSRHWWIPPVVLFGDPKKNPMRKKKRVIHLVGGFNPFQPISKKILV